MKKRTTHLPIVKPKTAARRQCGLDWNVIPKPAITPRSEYDFMRRYALLPVSASADGFGPENSGVVIQ